MAVYLTPGPSEPYPRLREFLDDAWSEQIVSLSHRGQAFKDIYRRADVAVRELMGVPDGYTLMFVGSATEAMERVVQGVVDRRSHHLVSGAFAEKWLQIAGQLGKTTTVRRAEAGQGFAQGDYEVPDDTELLCLTHNETSTGTVFAAADLARLVRPPHRWLVALDVVSSAPLAELPWEGLDFVFFSVQKAFGLPAGLGVVVASPRALERAAALRRDGAAVGSFHNLVELAEGAAKFQTPATPNVLGIYLLGRVAADMLAGGVPQLRATNQSRAKRLYEVLEGSDHLEPFVADSLWRSTTVVVADVRGGNAALHARLAGDGLMLGKGYKPFKEQHLRIANFPSLGSRDFDALMRSLQEFDGRR
ncbi:MAG: aminotransferase class [Patescibacteria group bacterium]|nr:aminotransferase class [Patescibacteria group bacterium]